MPATIRSIDMQIIDKIFAMESGYVLDFSDRTMARFFADYDAACERKTLTQPSVS